MACRAKLKDSGTCRIFFSSPFGGMEEEREELTKKYFPQIHHACNAKGIKFVPVDMRWGITKEAAENAQVMNICLREVARSDFFVGFFGQRYGWHSIHSNDTILSENFEKAMDKYPWVDKFHDRSMTEIECRAGHLNSPGAMPSCFCFRDKAYDDIMKEEGEKNKDASQVMKFTIENEHADAMRGTLIQEVVDTQEKTWGVKLDCKDPQEMAKFIFDTLWKYLTEVVLVDLNEVEVPYLVQQRLVHDQFVTSASHIYCGCEEYLDHLTSKVTGPPVQGTVVTGPAGSGKSALLAKWMQLVQQAHPYVTILYHFIGCAPGTERPRNILERILLELRETFPDLKPKTPAPDDDSKTKNSNDNEETSVESKNETDVVKSNENVTDDSKPAKSEAVESLTEKNDEEEKDENSNKKVTDCQKSVSIDGNNTLQVNSGSVIENDLPKDSILDEKPATNLALVPKMVSDAKADGDNMTPKEDKTNVQEDESNSGDKKATSEDNTNVEDKSNSDDKKTSGKDNPSSKEKSEEEGKEKKSGLEKKSTQQILSEMAIIMNRITEEGHKVVIILDALNQQKIQDKTIKHLYWLPEAFPGGVTFICSTLDSDTASHDLLITERGMDKLVINPFDSQLQKKICVETLKVAGKELSPHQLERVINAKETSNALFLKLVLYELSIYGSFNQLDEKIDSLIYVSGVKPLLQVILERLEMDYCSNDYQGNIVKDVLCCLIASRKGLSETELTEILSIATHLWSPLFFALEHLLSQYTGLLGFAFSEMRDAVVERYLSNVDDIVSYKQKLIKYFDGVRQTMRPWIKSSKPEFGRVIQELPWIQIDIKDKEGLIQTLSDLSMLRKLASTSLNELLYLWQATGLRWSAVSNLYMTSFDKAIADLYQEMQNGVLEETDSPGMKLRVTLQYMRMIFSEAYYALGYQKAMEREVRVLESCKSSMSEEKRAEYLRDARYYLAMSYAEQQDTKRALPIYMAIHEECKKLMKENKTVDTEVKEMLAFSSNGIGLIHYHLKDHAKAEEYLLISKNVHKEMKNKMHEGASTTNLGLTYLDSKKHDKALDYFDEAKQLYEDHYFGKISIDIGNLYTNIALTHRRMKNLDKAEEYYHKSLEMKAMNVGWNHPVIATAYMNLGTLEVFRKNHVKAEEWTRKAIWIYETNEYPITERSHRMCRENLCTNLVKQGRKREVLPLYIEITNILVDNNWVDEIIVSLHRDMLEYMIEKSMFADAQKFALAILKSSKRRTRFAYLLADADSKSPPKDPRPPELTLEAFMKEYPNDASLKILYVTSVLSKKNSIEEIIDMCHHLHDTHKELEESAYSFAADSLTENSFHESAVKLVELGLEKYPKNVELVDSGLLPLVRLERIEEFTKYLSIVMATHGTKSIEKSNVYTAGTLLKDTHPILAGKCFHKLATAMENDWHRRESKKQLKEMFPDGVPDDVINNDNDDLGNKEKDEEDATETTTSTDKSELGGDKDDLEKKPSPSLIAEGQNIATPSESALFHLLMPHQAMSEGQNVTAPSEPDTSQLDHLLMPHQAMSEGQNVTAPSEPDTSQLDHLLMPHQAMSEGQNVTAPSEPDTSQLDHLLMPHQAMSEGQNVTAPSEPDTSQLDHLLMPHQAMSEGQNVTAPSEPDTSQLDHLLMPHQAMSEGQNVTAPSEPDTSQLDHLLMPHQAMSEGLNVTAPSEPDTSQLDHLLMPHQAMSEGQNVTAPSEPDTSQLDHLLMPHQAMSEGQNVTAPSEPDTSQLDHLLMPHQAMSEGQNVTAPSEPDTSQLDHLLMPHQAMSEGLNVTAPSEPDTSQLDHLLMPHQAMSEGQNVTAPSEPDTSQLDHLLMPHQAMSEGQNVTAPSEPDMSQLDHLLMPHQAMSEGQNVTAPSEPDTSQLDHLLMPHQAMSEGQNVTAPSEPDMSQLDHLLMPHQAMSEGQNITAPSETV